MMTCTLCRNKTNYLLVCAALKLLATAVAFVDIVNDTLYEILKTLLSLSHGGRRSHFLCHVHSLHDLRKTGSAIVFVVVIIVIIPN